MLKAPSDKAAKLAQLKDRLERFKHKRADVIHPRGSTKIVKRIMDRGRWIEISRLEKRIAELGGTPVPEVGAWKKKTNEIILNKQQRLDLDEWIASAIMKEGPGADNEQRRISLSKQIVAKNSRLTNSALEKDRGRRTEEDLQRYFKILHKVREKHLKKAKKEELEIQKSTAKFTDNKGFTKFELQTIYDAGKKNYLTRITEFKGDITTELAHWQSNIRQAGKESATRKEQSAKEHTLRHFGYMGKREGQDQELTRRYIAELERLGKPITEGTVQKGLHATIDHIRLKIGLNADTARTKLMNDESLEYWMFRTEHREEIRKMVHVYEENITALSQIPHSGKQFNRPTRDHITNISAIKMYELWKKEQGITFQQMRDENNKRLKSWVEQQGRKESVDIGTILPKIPQEKWAKFKALPAPKAKVETREQFMLPPSKKTGSTEEQEKPTGTSAGWGTTPGEGSRKDLPAPEKPVPSEPAPEKTVPSEGWKTTAGEGSRKDLPPPVKPVETRAVRMLPAPDTKKYSSPKKVYPTVRSPKDLERHRSPKKSPKKSGLIATLHTPPPTPTPVTSVALTRLTRSMKARVKTKARSIALLKKHFREQIDTDVSRLHGINTFNTSASTHTGRTISGIKLISRDEYITVDAGKTFHNKPVSEVKDNTSAVNSQIPFIKYTAEQNFSAEELNATHSHALIESHSVDTNTQARFLNQLDRTPVPQKPSRTPSPMKPSTYTPGGDTASGTAGTVSPTGRATPTSRPTTPTSPGDTASSRPSKIKTPKDPPSPQPEPYKRPPELEAKGGPSLFSPMVTHTTDKPDSSVQGHHYKGRGGYRHADDPAPGMHDIELRRAKINVEMPDINVSGGRGGMPTLLTERHVDERIRKYFRDEKPGPTPFKPPFRRGGGRGPRKRPGGDSGVPSSGGRSGPTGWGQGGRKSSPFEQTGGTGGTGMGFGGGSGGTQGGGGDATQGGGSGGGGGRDPGHGSLAPGGTYAEQSEEEDEDDPDAQLSARARQLKMWGEFLREREMEIQQKEKKPRDPPKQLKTIEQPAIIPVVPSEPSLRYSGKDPTKDPSKPGLDKSINIKVTTRNIINEKKRKKQTKKGITKKGITKARKAYNSLKRQTIRAIRLGKKDAYREQSNAIKKLPPKKRKAARAKLKKLLKTREFTLVSKLPAATKMSLADLARVTKIAQKLRW